VNIYALLVLIVAVIAVAIGLEQLTAWVWPPHDLLICL
jgi:hypothetical protein